MDFIAGKLNVVEMNGEDEGVRESGGANLSALHNMHFDYCQSLT